jgi:mono/diheme cytochrome c family protein
MSKTRWLGLLLLLLLLAACQNGMEDQPKYEPFEASTFFRSGSSAQPLLANTVARGQLRADAHLYTGQVNGAPATEFPFPVTSEVLARGQERYNIYCSPCHGFSGYGDGIIVQRGLTPPPSFHTDRLRNIPVGHIFDVITNGFGVMYSYSDRVAPEDRWAIVAYIQALQLSQNATIDDVPPDAQGELEAAGENETENTSQEETE